MDIGLGMMGRLLPFAALALSSTAAQAEPARFERFTYEGQSI